MTLVALPEEGLARIDESTGCDELSIAERYERDRAALMHPDPEERRAAVARLVESGSAAVYPLLCAVHDDTCMGVREAAVWSLLRLTHDLLGESAEEGNAISRLLQDDPEMDGYLRLGIQAISDKSRGKSPAGTAFGRLWYLDDASRKAGLRFLREMTRIAPDLDPELPVVLRRSRRHPIPAVRRRCASFLSEYEQWRSAERPPASARPASALAERRDSETAVPDRVTDVLSDPDRRVRHQAAARLYCETLNGGQVLLPSGVEFVDAEVKALFVEGAKELRAVGSVAGSLGPSLASSKARQRRCSLRLLVHLCPLLEGTEAAAVDELVSVALRDKVREVRGEAIAVASICAGESAQIELVGRLRTPVRSQRVIHCLSGGQIIAFLVGLVFIWLFDNFRIGIFLPQCFGLAILAYRRLGGRQKHQISESEYLETLGAMEKVAESSPEKLRHAMPELRMLTGRMAEPEVRAKARKILAKMHEATLHELPIAATAPEREPATLPVPASVHQQPVPRP